jgi:hypothetical protein
VNYTLFCRLRAFDRPQLTFRAVIHGDRVRGRVQPRAAPANGTFAIPRVCLFAIPRALVGRLPAGHHFLCRIDLRALRPTPRQRRKNPSLFRRSAHKPRARPLPLRRAYRVLLKLPRIQATKANYHRYIPYEGLICVSSTTASILSQAGATSQRDSRGIQWFTVVPDTPPLIAFLRSRQKSPNLAPYVGTAQDKAVAVQTIRPDLVDAGNTYPCQLMCTLAF